MEEKINIAEILKGKSNGIRLYSPIFGECTFCCVSEDTNDICVKKHNGEKALFDSKGLYYNTGEVMLFPSKQMRDWRKFFKKGDVLVCYEGKNPYYTIFDGFENNTYQTFNGKFAYDSYEDKWYQNECNLSTTTFHKLSLADSEIYITKIEERFFGKMNLETLEIEKHTEFKDGDVVFVRLKRFCFIEIFNYFKGDYLYDHASLSTKTHTIDICGKYPIYKDEIVEIRIANDSEKKQLFEALSKENKVWNAEKKQVVDLKIKWITPKPFDRVITRNAYDDIWTANIFSHMNSCGEYVTIGCAGGYHYCLPYNDETAHLLGTTDEWKVGKG